MRVSRSDVVGADELIDFGAPTYLPMERRGVDATRPTVPPPMDTEPPIVVVPDVVDVVVATLGVAPDVDIDAVGRIKPPVARNEPARDDAVAFAADAADSYVPTPPILRTAGAAGAAVAAATHNIDNNDVFIPSLISLSLCKVLYHNFGRFQNPFYIFFIFFLKFISNANRK